MYYLQYIQLIVEGGLESIKVEAQNILNGLELGKALTSNWLLCYQTFINGLEIGKF